MVDPSLDEVNRLLAAANAVRWQGDGAGKADEAGAADAERRLETLFHTSRTLAIYGTLAPGQPNHHVVAPLGGEWADGVIEGDLVPVGWGATLGYPAFRPRAGGPAVAVKVLTAPALATAWPDLDRFECYSWDPQGNSCQASFCDDSCQCSGQCTDDPPPTVIIAYCQSAAYTDCCQDRYTSYDGFGRWKLTCS